MIITTKELAKRWQCSEQHIREQCNTGKLNYIKTAPKYRFNLNYIEQIENEDLNPLSRMERLRLEKEIDRLNKIIEERDSYINRFKLLALGG